MRSDTQGMRTRTSFPQLCTTAIFNIKLVGFRAFKNTKSYGDYVRDKNFLASGIAGDMNRPLAVE